jgi:flagellar export protein FliJ
MLIKANTRSTLLSLKSLPLQERLNQQQLVMDSNLAIEVKIKSLLENINSIKEESDEKKKEVMVARKARKGLEMLREKALEEFEIEYNKKEQLEIDEVSIMANARRIVHNQSYTS